jgi:hypothetical protein
MSHGTDACLALAQSSRPSMRKQQREQHDAHDDAYRHKQPLAG